MKMDTDRQHLISNKDKDPHFCHTGLIHMFFSSSKTVERLEDFEPHWTQTLLDNLPALVNARRGQCAIARERELQVERGLFDWK